MPLKYIPIIPCLTELRFKFQSSGVQQFQEGVDREGKVTVVKLGENEQDVVFTMDFVFASTGAGKYKIC